ncbi:class I SAM-dependent methyltransferase [Microbulbifer aggregans]|uniref:class I SAM-dependent methyltransferase n=1 Tax=Microbulbifer aggregans TaxID=1769779 RepID=UPI001CFCB76D|nr:class I SAM-dependent methyltransferase [Microbulbifer aggregans]
MKGQPDNLSCPLCHGVAQPYHQDKFRSYNQCANCALVFVPSHFWLSADEEKSYYDLHENSESDAGYRQFLNRCAAPLLGALPPRSVGLDFGCGPAPLLAQMLSDAGHSVSIYDHFYFNDHNVLERQYDFVVSTEVVEHLSQPWVELERLWSLIKPGGLLALMTKMVISHERFANWHYIRDPTHIIFFSEPTFHWLADALGAEVEFVAPDVIFLRKP